MNIHTYITDSKLYNMYMSLCIIYTKLYISYKQSPELQMPEHTLHVSRTIRKPGFLEHSEGKTRKMVERWRPEQGGPAGVLCCGFHCR